MGSMLCTQRELSDNEVTEEIKNNLDKANVLTLKEIKEATIARKIPTAIVKSGASTICVQPAEEQMQKSECSLYTWDNSLSKTNKKSNKIFQMAE